jgi:hypothetical protein
MRIRILGSLAAFLLIAPAVSAVSFGFEGLTNNHALDVAIGEAQLQLDVTDDGNGIVRFALSNSGPARSSLTDVYFDSDYAMLKGMAIVDRDQNSGDSGVDFSKGASPGNLPGWQLANPDFMVSRGLSADSDPPVQRNGVNPGEVLVLLFSTRGPYDFDDVIAALDSGHLRVGIHVQAFASGGSESFLNERSLVGNPVPEPNSALLSAIAIGGVGGVLRRRARS